MRRFKKILYVHEEGSDVATATLNLAVDLAKRNGGLIDLISVIELPPIMFTSSTAVLLQSRWQKNTEEQLEELARAVAPNGNLKTKVLTGKPHIQIVREVLRHGYDLVIKPIGPSGLIDRLLSSVDMRLLVQCPCPVWLSKGEAYGAFDHVLVAVDAAFEAYGGGKADDELAEDALNKQILELAFSLCADSNAELHVGHAWYPPFLSTYSRARANVPEKEIEAYVDSVKREHTNWLKRLMTKASKWVGADVFKSIKLHTHLRNGGPDKEIPKLISEIQSDLVIMGTVARTGISGLVMGNTAEKILDKVTCSVLAVKPPSFKTHVTLDD
jgi:nucleotide-binding universal stress UspA family protein